MPLLTSANSTIIDELVETAVPALKAISHALPMRTFGSPSLVRSLFRLGLVDQFRIMVFPTIHGLAGECPVFADLPALRISLVRSSRLETLRSIPIPELPRRLGGQEPRVGRAEGG